MLVRGGVYGRASFVPPLPSGILLSYAYVGSQHLVANTMLAWSTVSKCWYGGSSDVPCGILLP